MELEKILPENGPPIDEVNKYIEKYKNELIVIKYGGNAVSYTHLTLPTIYSV